MMRSEKTLEPTDTVLGHFTDFRLAIERPRGMEFMLIDYDGGHGGNYDRLGFPEESSLKEKISVGDRCFI